MRLGGFLAALQRLELELAGEYRERAAQHSADHDVFHQCRAFAAQSERHADELALAIAHSATDDDGVQADLWAVAHGTSGEASATPAGGSPPGGLILLRDLRGLFLCAQAVSSMWAMAGQAAQAARDAELIGVADRCREESELQAKWFMTRLKVAAPQALVTG